MRQIRKPTVAAVFGLGVLTLIAIPGIAASEQLAQGGQGNQRADQPCPVAKMGSGMGGQGMMGSGMGGQGMMGSGTGGQGMMGSGMGGQGMMGSGMGGQGMMGSGMGGQGMMGPSSGKEPGFSDPIVPSRDLTADDVRHSLEHRLELRGNKRLKVGEVKEADDDRIIADITTVDGSLVQRFEVDRHTGTMRDVE